MEILNFADNHTVSFTAKSPFELAVSNFLADWNNETATVEVKSSGSTGTPKIFSVSKDKMRNSAEMTCDFLGLNSGDSALLCLPVEYISGKMMTVRAIERKLCLFISESSLSPLSNLSTEIDFCAMTPLQVENSLDKIHLIRKIIIGGAAVSESLKRKIFETLNKNSESQTEIFETYGMTETLSHIALKKIYPQSENYFTAFEGVEISLDERGCLKIFAPKVNGELLQTNDLVEIKNENQFRFLGRLDNVINSGGAKIFPEELEALIKKEIPNEVLFVGIPDEILGQKLIMIVEDEENHHLRELLEQFKFEKNFHRPKEIIFTQKIPRTPNGKVDRREMLKTLGL